MNKLSYDEALKQLKVLELVQHSEKRRPLRFSPVLSAKRNSAIAKRKKELNLLLSIIHAHKTARKLYAENYRLKKVLYKNALDRIKGEILDELKVLK